MYVIAIRVIRGRRAIISNDGEARDTTHAIDLLVSLVCPVDTILAINLLVYPPLPPPPACPFLHA